MQTDMLMTGLQMNPMQKVQIRLLQVPKHLNEAENAYLNLTDCSSGLTAQAICFSRQVKKMFV